MRNNGDYRDIQLMNNTTEPFSPRAAAPNTKAKVSQAQLTKLKVMEGELKIIDYSLLQINYPKAIFFALLMALSVVGLFLLKYYVRLRACLFYSAVPQDDIDTATHVYVEGCGQVEEICQVETETFQHFPRTLFTFRHLRYEFIEGTPYPLGLHYLDNPTSFVKASETLGVRGENVESQRAFYGANEHLVEVPWYHEYMFDTMTKPFFLFQYFVCFIWIIEGRSIFAILMLVFTIVTTSINYLLLRRSYAQIKQTAEKVFEVVAIRAGNRITVNNIDLVPGDLFVPSDEIPCDAVVVKGELFVDEVSLTGENVPVPKSRLLEAGKIEEDCHWLWEGSRLETMREGTLAMAVQIGFASRRGRIIRKILSRVPRQPQYFVKLLVFLCEAWLVAVLVYFATFWMMFDLEIETIMIIIRFFDFLAYSFPPAFPIYFNLAYSFCLVRLHRDGVIGTESEKTIQSSRLRTICFDKTGTLTLTEMKLAHVYSLSDSTLQEITVQTHLHPTTTDVFATCHSIESISNQLKGDEIDLRMYNHTKATLSLSSSPGVVREVRVEDRVLEVLRINQYESRFQSMSVLWRNRESGQVFVGVKGSPQKIHSYCLNRMSTFEGWVKLLSLSGYRSIGFGFKRVEKGDVDRYMVLQRESFLEGVTLLGVAAFGNELKQDAVETVETLGVCGVTTKIITGDNIYLGVKTAMMVGMVTSHQRVVVLEGSKYDEESGRVAVVELREGTEKVQEKSYTIDKFNYEDDPGVVYAIDDAFLEKKGEYLHRNVRVFARITPEHKGAIVRKHVQLEKQHVDGRSYWEKLTGQTSLKVGMVGDGANDLIAIKEADVGIGFSNCDAVYSASFAVQSLSQIVLLIREAKNVERQVMDMVQYFSFLNFLNIVATILQNNDASYLSSAELLFRNFALILLMTLFMGLSLPAQRLTKWLPPSNFMGLEHQLVFWGNVLIYAAALILGYRLVRESGDFVPNPQPLVTFQSGFNGTCMSATIMFLLTQAAYTITPVFLHRGDPWKQPFYRNIPMLVLFLINVVLTALLFFFTNRLSVLTLVSIPTSLAGVLLAIIVGFGILAGVYSKIIEGLKLHERLDEKDTLQNDGHST